MSVDVGRQVNSIGFSPLPAAVVRLDVVVFAIAFLGGGAEKDQPQ
jgi:hypothetical protein